MNSQSYGQHDTRYAQPNYQADYSQGYAQTGDYSAVATDQYAQTHYDDRSGAYNTTGYGKYWTKFCPFTPFSALIWILIFETKTKQVS